MTKQNMRQLCDEIKLAIIEANDKGDRRRVDELKWKKKQIKAKILQYGNNKITIKRA
jgi:hypothetical protein